MAGLEGIDFPEDRSILEVRQDWISVEVVSRRLAPAFASAPTQALGFAVLFVFSRLTDQPMLLLRGTAVGDQNETAFLSAMIAPEATLQQAFATLRHDADPSDGAVVNLVLDSDGSASGVGPDGPARLSCHSDADALRLTLRFDAGRLSPLSARDFLDKVAVVLEALADRPDQHCADLELIGDTARRLIPDLSRPIPVLPFDPVSKTFFEVAAQHGDQPAVTNGPYSYTYTELSGAVRALAGHLLAAGLQPGEVVAVSGLSSFGTLAGMLAVLTAGGVLVTVDHALPEARQALILQVSCPRLQIKVGPEDNTGTEADAIPMIDWPKSDSLQRLIATAPPAEAVSVTPAPDASAYIFFTSGSTGLPKGVLGTHLGLSHFLS